MAKRIGGSRRKSRHKMAKSVREKGKFSLADYFQTFKEGDNVCLVAEPAVQKGFYHARFHGRAGTILAKRGACYEVEVQDKDMKKTLVIHPIHLQRR